MKRKIVIALALVGTLAVSLIASTLMSSPASGGDKNTIVLSSDNLLTMTDVVDSASVAQVLLKAQELDKSNLLGNKSKKKIYLYLYTPGGSIQAGMELKDGVKGLGRPVDTITSFAASMGFQIAQGLGERLITPSGVLMSHHAQGGFEGEFGGQAPSQIDNRYGLWLERLTDMDMITVKRTNGRQTLASYQKSYENELWLTSSKAIAGGYADRVVNVSCDDFLKGTDKKSLEFFGMKINYEVSKCPLITGPLNVQASIVTTKGYLNSEEFSVLNGGFGPYCQQSKEENKVCALDTTLTSEKISELKNLFLARYEQRQKTPIRMNINYSSYSFDWNSGVWIGK